MDQQPADINDPVQYVRGVGPRRAEMFERIGVWTVRDLLYLFPRKYHDRRNLVPIAKAEPGSNAMVLGDVIKTSLHRRGRGRGVLTVHVRDETGIIRAVWFNQNYLAERFDAGDTVLLWGPVRLYDGLEMISPGFEHVGADEHGGIALTDEMSRFVPVYPLTEGLSQGQLRPIVRTALDLYAAAVPEVLPETLRARYGLPGIADALREAHFPESVEAKERAKHRLIYEEFLLFELAIALRRHKARTAEGIAFKVSAEFDRRIRKLFPFSLTPSQEAALGEIKLDMQDGVPMNRLLQGDVGCGKTVVALYAMLLAAANKYQSAIMAPTEILAEQHHRTIGRMLDGSKVRIGLLTGSADRRQVLAEIERGDVDIVIGTHAVIQSDVAFHRLGLVVIDEQHKFGVMQRATLRWKGRSPDVLVMTATPIPRTLALTIFGDLDVSTIREMPPGRKPVVTLRIADCGLRNEEDETQSVSPRRHGTHEENEYPSPPCSPCLRGESASILPAAASAKADRGQIEKSEIEAYEFIRNQASAGRQAYVVCPLIEQSEALDLRSAVDTADELAREVFPEFRVGLLHGRMTADEKEQVMAAFERGQTQILVSTIVIEVGIDVPNATVMLVLHAERFGLAQLHQLRGRIGRGPDQAYCLLCSEAKSADAKQRLKVLCETADGFRIAEEDLKLRGTGELGGTRQHGLPDVRIGDFTADFETLELARDDATGIVADDPKIERPEHAALRERMFELYRDHLSLIGIG